MNGDNPKSDTAALFGVNVPQRYSVNEKRYMERGGLVRLADDVRGFVLAEDNRADMARFYFFCLAFDQIAKEGIAGDIAELGVYKGHTASILAIMARRLGSTLYLLDTFQGFSGNDLRGIDTEKKMGFTDTSVEAVRAIVGDKNVQFVPGYFPSTASQLPADATFALVHLDCDLYAPMASALIYFYPRLAPGGFLIIHDYSSMHWDGAERAVHEFFADKAESIVPLPDSGGSIVIRKIRTPDRYKNWYVQENAKLFGPAWAEASGGGLSAVLGDGWSTPEGWGVWGVDEVHQLHVFLDAAPTERVELEFDVTALLLDNATHREVDIQVGGETIDRWTFTSDENRAVRKLFFWHREEATGGAGLPVILVEFRPTEVAVAADVLPDVGDRRRLGVGLHRLRRLR